MADGSNLAEFFNLFFLCFFLPGGSCFGRVDNFSVKINGTAWARTTIATIMAARVQSFSVNALHLVLFYWVYSDSFLRT